MEYKEIKWDANAYLDDFTAWINGKCLRIEQMDEKNWWFKISEGDKELLEGNEESFDKARDSILKYLEIID